MNDRYYPASKREPMDVYAWRIKWKHLPNEVGIVAASGRKNAVGKVQVALGDLGWYASVCDISCGRAPECDKWAKQLPEEHRHRVVLEVYVQQDMARMTVDLGDVRLQESS